MIQLHDLNTPNLNQLERAALLTASNAVEQGFAHVTVSLTYRKQTDTKARIAGENYVKMPGVSHEAQTGLLAVERYVDNKVNRKLGRVGKVYLRVKSVTRADGANPTGFTHIRPEGITGFVVLGVQPIQRTAQTQGV
jgi:hypothetical protein